MEFKGRALYNLLKTSIKEDPSLRTESWQVADYRSFSEKELSDKLSKLGLPLTRESFLLYAENSSSPEELIDCLWIQEDDLLGQEKAYLIVFELWRRYLPNRQSLSIFCDELDNLISLFDDGVYMEDEAWQAVLSELEDILDQNTDSDPKETFASVSQYTAHDIASFLYDYIFELLEEENETLATSLIEAFDDYVPEKKWFSLLRARLLPFSLMQAKESLIHRLLEEEEEKPDPSFLTELLLLTKELDDSSLFFSCLKLLRPLVKAEEELKELSEHEEEFSRTLAQNR